MPIQAALTRAPGVPLAEPVRLRLERSLGVDLAPVRVHQHAAASALVDELGARAFTFGSDVFIGSAERATDLGLMAHEVAHVVQQQEAPAVQQLGPSSGADPLETEASRAASAVVAGERACVSGRTAPRPQFLFGWARRAVRAVGSAVSAVASAVGDIAGVALRFIRDHARVIPGYDMLALILTRDPITGDQVPRTPVNVIRALMGLWPGGSLFFDALQRYGIIDRVGTWLHQQVDALVPIVAGIGAAVRQFVGTLGASDIVHPGDAWDRARRIFTEPIERAWTAARAFAAGVLGFIRDAVLRPLAALASRTRGYDLLKLVLGHDPVTGEDQPRTAEAMIGGFMRLIGEEEKWRHLQESRAIPRAWAWFQQQFGLLMGIVREVPPRFMASLRTLGVADLLNLGGAFARVGGVFLGFVREFITWAGNAAIQVMMFIFEALAPEAMPVLRRAAAAFRTIVRDPVRFVRYLVRAGVQGFEQFRANIRTHLVNGLVGWITGALGGAGLQLPARWDLRGILSLVLQILGLTWANIRTKLVRVMGERVVSVLETTFTIVMTLVREGPAAAWQQILEQLSNLQEMVMGQVREWVISTVVGQAVMRIASMLNPAGAVIQAILAIYNTILFVRQRLQQIAQVADAFVSSISAIAAGDTSAAANRVEQTMARLVPVVISFLAQLIGLGGISDTIRNIIGRIRAPVDRALDRVVDWLAAQARRLGQAVVSAGVPRDPTERVRAGVRAASAVVNRFAGRRVGAAVLTPLLAAIRVRYQMQTLEVVPRGARWGVRGVVNPTAEEATNAETEAPGAAGAPTGVRGQVAQALMTSIPAESTREDVIAAIGRVRPRFPRDVVPRIDAGPEDATGGFPIMVEASEYSPLLLMRIATGGGRVMVALTSTLRFSRPVALATPREFLPLGSVPIPGAAPGQVLGVASPAGIHVVRPEPMTRPTSATAPRVAEEVRSRTHQAVAFNTASPSLSQNSDNTTHAERQFINYFRTDVRREDIPFLQRVELTISHSPCSLCAQHGSTDLVSFLREVMGHVGHAVAPVFAVRYTTAFTSGPNATLTEDVAALRAAGWLVAGPAITLTRAQREARQRRLNASRA